MRIALVDDDPRAMAALAALFAEALGDAATIEQFDSGEAFLRVWSAGTFDLVVLDIFMGEMTGMDVARCVRETDAHVRLVFGTSSNEFASESYEVNASYYLRKPFRREQVAAMLDRLDLAEMELSRAIRLPDGQAVVLRRVIFADFADHSVTLHCKEGQRIVSRLPFSEIQPLLCAYPYFFSPSKGIVVNFYEVEARQGDVFLMSDGERVPISRRRAREVLDAYAAFRFGNLRKGREG